MFRKFSQLLLILFVFFVFWFESSKAHPSPNILEDCVLYIPDQNRGSLKCTISISILFSTDIANKIDDNGNKEFEEVEKTNWINETITKNIQLLVNGNVVDLRGGDYEISHYSKLIQDPEQNNLYFDYDIDLSQFDKISEVEFVSKTNLDPTATKKFHLDISSILKIDIHRLDGANPNKLPLIPKESISTSYSEQNIFERVYSNISEFFSSKSVSTNNLDLNNSIRGITDVFSIKGFIIIIFVTFFAGIAHALTPGHGKAFISAVLLGSSDHSYRKAVLLAFSITISHTSSIILIGLFYTVFNTFVRSPYAVVVVLNYISYILIILVGIHMIYKNMHIFKRIKQSGLSHHTHHHHEFNTNNLSISGIIRDGISGGLAPCPEALAILLIAINKNQFFIGVIVVFIFSMGMALALTGFGVIALKLKDRLHTKVKSSKLFLILPLLSGMFITILGILLLLRAV